MRKSIGHLWLALAGALLLSNLTRVPGLALPDDWVLDPANILACALRWPLLLIALSYVTMPRPGKLLKSDLERTDRTWFAKVLLVAAAAVLLFKVMRALL